MVSPPAAHCVVGVVHVLPPGEESTVYEVTGAPPLLGASQLTVAAVLPRVAVVAVGASGIVAGVTGLVGVEVGDVPTALVAVAVKV